LRFLYTLHYLFFHHPSTPWIYTLSLHDALPILEIEHHLARGDGLFFFVLAGCVGVPAPDYEEESAIRALRGLELALLARHVAERSEEHTSELQSLAYLVCRLLLEKKKRHIHHHT